MDQQENLGSPLPKKWVDEVSGLDHEEAATDFSKHRTEMSTHRTQMSEHRTYMSSARSHMSNERTHLSYLRTSLAMLSFGITLNRFSLFLQENRTALPKGHRFLIQTEYVGLGIICLGILILAWSLYHYNEVEKAISSDSYKSPRLPIRIFTWAIFILGGLSTLWIMFGRF